MDGVPALRSGRLRKVCEMGLGDESHVERARDPLGGARPPATTAKPNGYLNVSQRLLDNSSNYINKLE